MGALAQTTVQIVPQTPDTNKQSATDKSILQAVLA